MWHLPSLDLNPGEPGSLHGKSWVLTITPRSWQRFNHLKNTTCDGMFNSDEKRLSKKINILRKIEERAYRFESSFSRQTHGLRGLLPFSTVKMELPVHDFGNDWYAKKYCQDTRALFIKYTMGVAKRYATLRCTILSLTSWDNQTTALREFWPRSSH